MVSFPESKAIDINLPSLKMTFYNVVNVEIAFRQKYYFYLLLWKTIKLILTVFIFVLEAKYNPCLAIRSPDIKRAHIRVNSCGACSYFQMADFAVDS